MNSIIEIKKIEKDYNSCNCCRDKDITLFELSFIYGVGNLGSSGITISLCENCINKLTYELTKLEFDKEED